MIQLFALITISFLALFALQTGVPADALSGTEGGYDRIIHFRSNAYHLWRTFGENSLLLPLLYIAFTTGIFLYLLKIKKCPLIGSTVSTIFLTVALPLLLGRDTVLLYCLAPLPYVMIFLQIQASPLLTFLLYVFSTLLLILTAQQLAPVLCFAAFLLSARSAILNRRFLFVFLLCYLGAFVVPNVDIPDYPAKARVVADDGLPGDIRPLAHAAGPIQLRDTAYMKQEAKAPALLLLGVFLALAFFSKSRTELIPAAIFLSFLLLDVFLRENLRIIAPLDTLHRVLPGLHFYTLIPLTLGLILLSLSIPIARLGDKAASLLALLPLVFIFFALDKLTLVKQADFERFEDLIAAGIDRKILVSPSFAIYRESDYVPPRASDAKFISSRAIRDTFAERDDEVAEKRFHRLEDKNKHTRWSPQKGGQSGNEKLYIRFNEPARLNGLRLETGDFFSDFPRGIRLSSLATCNSTKPEVGTSPSYETILEIPHWKGSLRYTPLGYPYYGPEHEATLRFPERAVQCLLIEQIGHSIYDWSVAELSYSGTFPPGVKKHKKK